MTGHEEGYVRFRCEWEPAPPPSGPEVEALRGWRDRLRRLGLVGAYRDGVGFGNLSHRLADGSFLVSGTQTGALPSLGPEHFSVVVGCEPARNRLRCRGPAKASSESLSHDAVYRSVPSARAVFHVHHDALWRRLLGRTPTTDPAAEAGTPEMALAIAALLRDGEAGGGGLLVMGGHPEGLISFGATPGEAGERLVEALGSLVPPDTPGHLPP